ncbi:uncharacterized protein V1516DRAFT_689049 [Lipomyces oligophaga]|uniref:uncharacterized protein n=1 Tax=Lipomyces oligophaga TaxID=45792 RepID=UPI0034CE6887
MGVKGIWDCLAPYASVKLLSKLTEDHIIKYGRPPRAAIDASNWLFHTKDQVATQIRYSQPRDMAKEIAKDFNKDSDIDSDLLSMRSSPEPTSSQQLDSVNSMQILRRTIFYKLLNLFELRWDLVFVFDGIAKPEEKRGKKRYYSADIPRENIALEILPLFGFHWHRAPAEGEAQCAYLKASGIVDYVISDDSDTFVFGATDVIQIFPRSSQRQQISSQLVIDNSRQQIPYLDVLIYELRDQVSREDLIFMALMTGGDYDKGTSNCGERFALQMAKAGYAKSFFKAYPDVEKLRQFKSELLADLKENKQGNFNQRCNTMTLDKFPHEKALNLYLNPIVDKNVHIDWASRSWDLEAIKRMGESLKREGENFGMGKSSRVIDSIMTNLIADGRGEEYIKSVYRIDDKTGNVETDSVPSSIRFEVEPYKIMNLSEEQSNQKDIKKYISIPKYIAEQNYKVAELVESFKFEKEQTRLRAEAVKQRSKLKKMMKINEDGKSIRSKSKPENQKQTKLSDFVGSKKKTSMGSSIEFAVRPKAAISEVDVSTQSSQTDHSIQSSPKRKVKANSFFNTEDYSSFSSDSSSPPSPTISSSARTLVRKSSIKRGRGRPKAVDMVTNTAAKTASRKTNVKSYYPPSSPPTTLISSGSSTPKTSPARQSSVTVIDLTGSSPI